MPSNKARASVRLDVLGLLLAGLIGAVLYIIEGVRGMRS